jgi:type II secretory pathway pseudopilin PulG
MKDFYRNKGFTQVELLLVILITGIVPTITTPLLINYSNFRQANHLNQIAPNF